MIKLIVDDGISGIRSSQVRQMPAGPQTNLLGEVVLPTLDQWRRHEVDPGFLEAFLTVPPRPDAKQSESE